MTARAVLLDIEGTVSSLPYVVNTLFPYARARLDDWLAAHADEPRVQTLLAETRALAEPGEPPADALRRWADEDRKVAPLKTVQGWIWAEGYAGSAFTGHVYPDVPPALRRWRARGLSINVFSSGSVQSQTDFFAHVPEGDLRPLFARHFDLAIGPKTAVDSYVAIADALGRTPATLHFLSDHAGELAAARQAGVLVTQVLREGLEADGRFPAVTEFTGWDP